MHFKEMDPLKIIEEYEDTLDLEKSLCKELEAVISEIKRRRQVMTESERKNYILTRDAISTDINTVRRRILTLSDEVSRLFREY